MSELTTAQLIQTLQDTSSPLGAKFIKKVAKRLEEYEKMETSLLKAWLLGVKHEREKENQNV